MKIISVVGARPNFMKIAPFINAIQNYNQQLSNNSNEQSSSSEKTGDSSKSPSGGFRGLLHLLVHTGQHYDDRMSRAFFESLGIPEANINLGIGSGTHAEQVGNTMIAFEKVLLKEKPDWVVVVGDVNATLACSVTAKKLNIKVCHIEAGLRSGDMSMPEEINRLVTDRLSDLLLTPDKLSSENLRKEGVPEHKIQFVGNIMIDTLETNRDKAAELEIGEIIERNLIDGQSINSKFQSRKLSGPNSKKDVSDLSPLGEIKRGKPETRNEEPEILERFALMTMHRPSNVDEKEVLTPLFRFLADEVTEDMPLIWPIHPRTQARLKEFGLWEQATSCKNLILLHPIGYHEMLRLNMDATIMLTDSGGLQEECCVLGTPCLTLRWNTERPVTLREHGGASVLVGNNVERIRKEYLDTLKLKRTPQRPELWDGQTAMRCVEAIIYATTHSSDDPETSDE